MNTVNVKQWILIHAVLLIFASLITVSTGNILYLVVISFFSFLWLIYLGKKEWIHYQPVGGYANYTTFLRLVILVTTLCLEADLSNIVLFLFLGLAIILDGMDGWLARRFDQVSEWGGLFDKEVDSFLVASFAILLHTRFQFPMAILFIGLLHYWYELLLYGLAWQDLKTPPNPVGKYVAATLFISLLLAVILPFNCSIWLVSAASFFTLFSFGISLFYKYRAKKRFNKIIKTSTS